MSTKIYTAWRCTPKVFSETFLPNFRSHCFNKTGKLVKYLADCLKTEALREIYDTKEWGKEISFEEFCKKKYIRFAQAFKLNALASHSNERDMFCIDCSINTWIKGRYVYIIPYGENWILKDFQPPEGVQDYCYWDNVDEPEGITYRQWKARGKNWDAICDDWDAGRCVHEVVNAKTKAGLVKIARLFLNEDQSYMVLPYESERAIYEERKTRAKELMKKFNTSYNGAMRAVE